jgi:hypothetical protein
MKIPALRALCLTLALAGCAPPPPGARARAGDDITVPSQGPRGFLASAPPADPSFTPLRCRVVGPETVCARDP